jgi:hypothetical protein
MQDYIDELRLAKAEALITDLRLAAVKQKLDGLLGAAKNTNPVD